MKSSGYFEIVGEIKEIEIVAVRGSIKDIIRLQKRYGIGRKKLKIKRILD